MIIYLSPEGRCGLENYVDSEWRKSDYPKIVNKSYEDLFMAKELASGTYIFSGLEQLTPSGKLLAEAIWTTLSNADQLVLNRPSLMPSRHGLLETMREAGINSFRSYETDHLPDDICFPVFVRQAEDHGGNMSELLGTRAELDACLRWQRLRGYRLRDLLVVEFCDTSDGGEEFRKYSAQYVNGEISARFLHVSLYWMVKAAGEGFRSEWAAEELEYIKTNPHAEELKHIFEMVSIDYGRIDYGLLDGRIQVWEINTNPTIGLPPGDPRRKKKAKWILDLQRPSRLHHFAIFQKMLESIDPSDKSQAAIPLKLPESLLTAWRREVKAEQRHLKYQGTVQRLASMPMLRNARDALKRTIGRTK